MSDSFRPMAKQWVGSWCATALTGVVLMLTTCDVTDAVEKKYWELSPYAIRIQLAVDDSARSRPSLGPDLASFLKQRILTTLHPLWSAEVEVAQGIERLAVINDMSTPEDQLSELNGRFDKQMFLNVVTHAEGYSIACREWDKSTRLWGPALTETVRQELLLPEESLSLLRRVFAPLAMVRSNPEDENQVTLLFKGSELPRRTEEAIQGAKGEVYQPLLIRFDHTGEVLPNGVSEVPWTFLVLEELDDGQWQCSVHSGIRRPFGIRRRGRSEHLAIALRSPPGVTRVRFFARHDKNQALSGYEVFRRLEDDTQTELLGLTDATGSIEVKPIGKNLVTLFLRSDGQLLAKVPVLPGATPLVEVPIADDSARLRAQAELVALREELIDVVARRNVLMARVRNRLKDGQFDEARNLLEELDDLPGRARFNQLISSSERDPDHISQDPRVQQRIEKLFADTRKLLGRYLDVRQITELRNEVSAAARGNKN